MNVKTIKWGIIGLGKIADKFTHDLSLVDGAEIYAVASRNIEKASVFAAKHKAGIAYGSYAALLEDVNVDVVYIATPHSFHHELALAAMKRSKHVLCEKPLGVNSSQVAELVACAKNNQVFLMEALWSRFNPSIRKIKSLIKDGVIGEVKSIQADFAFYALDRDKTDRTLNPELAGGSLLDVGIYPVFLSYLILGKPELICATSNFTSYGTEIQTSILFQYSDAQAVLYSSMANKTRMMAEISGTKGNLYLLPRWHEASGYVLEKDGERTTVELPLKGNGMVYEIEEVQQCIQSQALQSKLWSHSNSLDLIALLDSIRFKAGIQFPFESKQ